MARKRYRATYRTVERAWWGRIWRQQHLATIAASVVLVLCIGAASALAADQSPSSPGLISEAIQPDGLGSIQPLQTDPAAAERLPHRNLDREGALELLQGVFEAQLQSPAGIFDDLQVERFLADDVAVIARESLPDAPDSGDTEAPSQSVRDTAPADTESPGSTHVADAILLDSTIPLRTEGESGEPEVVDLSLKRTDGELQPANPLAEVGIPQRLGEGIELPGAGVTIRLAEAPVDRATSVIDESVGFLPNVATDTDLVLAPTPTGLETLTQLRSPDAPRSQTFNLDLPDGAVLRATEEGGALVSSGEKTLLAVAPPTAIDATGAKVPVRLDVTSSSLRLTAFPDDSAVYPILVDPLYQDYQWANSNYWQSGLCNSSFATSSTSFSCNTNEEWSYEHIENDGSLPFGIETLNRSYSASVPVPQGTPGIFIRSSGSLITGDKGSINYTVPRYFTDYEKYGSAPTSFISKMRLWNLDWNAFSSYPSPYVVAGLWDSLNGGSVSYFSHEGRTGHGLGDMSWEYVFPNSNQNTNVKIGYVSVRATETQPNQNTELYVGSASIELADNQAPGLAPIGPQATGWSDQTGPPISFVATDTGLGVHSLTATDEPTHGWKDSWKTPYGCIGVSGAACPRTWSWTDTGRPALQYNAATMPHGIGYLSVVAEDPVGNKSAVAKAQLKIDHKDPQLDLSGTLTEQSSLGTTAKEYSLDYSALDGDDAPAAALAPFGSAGTGTGATQRPLGVAADGKGKVWVVDRENTRVVQFDEEGKYVRQFGSAGSGDGQFLDPRGIAVSPAGNIWVSDVGNGRVQQFNSKGQFLQKFGTKVAAGGTSSGMNFIEPYGLATAPGGKLWVTDPAGRRVGLFTEAVGQNHFIRDVYGPGGALESGSSPIGVATDQYGNGWVLDMVKNRVQEFDPNGDFLMQFGTAGTGNGQLNAPTGIAVAPSGNIVVSDAGNNRLQVFKPSGSYLRQFGSLGSAAGQVNEPRGVAVGAGNVAFVADAANHRVVRWSHADQDPQSGVASTEVKIDGQLVEPKYAPGCATRNCAVKRSWTLHSANYATGSHDVEVTAIDAVGRKTTKALTIATVKDETAPVLMANNEFFTAPEGWLEQKTYSYSSIAMDAGGYGVSSLALKIDGKVIKSVSQPCPNGSCWASLSGSIDMNAFSGGAHPAELVATDLAGQTSKKVWTLNVDPQGDISAEESAATLDAVDATSDSTLVAPTEEVISAEERAAGNDPHIEERDGLLVSDGTPNVTVMGEDPDEGFSIGLPTTTIHAEPTGTPDAATPTSVVEGSTVLAANTAGSSDTLIRPTFNGVLAFQAIRDSLAPTAYSWDVALFEGQTLQAIDSQNVKVVFDDGETALLISAEPAHDAIGKSVPTSLSISSGNVLTLHVPHRSTSYVYPVVAGTGWQGGFTTTLVAKPKDEQQQREDREREEKEKQEALEREWTSSEPPPQEPSGSYPPATHGVVGPPIPLPADATDDEGASASSGGVRAYVLPFEWHQCAWDGPGGCLPWDVAIKGRYEYNGRYAWWKEDKPHPSCPYSSRLSGINLDYCNWAGKNHQRYGGGYHISASVLYHLEGALGASFSAPGHLTMYMYGSGYAAGHNTAALCNPLSVC